MKLRKLWDKPVTKLILAVLIVALLAGTGSVLRQGRAGVAANVAGTVAYPFRAAARAVVSWFEDLYGYIYQYDALVVENTQLKADLAEAQAAVREAQEAIEENQRLEALLGFAEENPTYTYATAKIVAWNASTWSSSFTLSRGSASGIQVGDAVITETGALAGTVVEVGLGYAEVRTMLDPGTQIGVLAGSLDITGIAGGSYLFLADGMLELSYLSDATRLLTGDAVLTSGSGGTLPAGLLVGSVCQLYTEAGGQITTASLTPACDFDTLTQVFVITDYAEEG